MNPPDPGTITVTIRAADVPEPVSITIALDALASFLIEQSAAALELFPGTYGLKCGGQPLDPKSSLRANQIADSDHLQLIDPTRRDSGREDITPPMETSRPAAVGTTDSMSPRHGPPA